MLVFELGHSGSFFHPGDYLIDRVLYIVLVEHWVLARLLVFEVFPLYQVEGFSSENPVYFLFYCLKLLPIK